MRKNKYVAFEGLDGCGKSTQSEWLVKRLQERGEKALWTREPGSPLIGINLRELILSHAKVEKATLELILQADRAEHTAKVKQLLDEGYWIISDRSAISGYVYGTACGNNPHQLLNVMAYSIQVYPDQVFYFDIPVEEAERRRIARGLPATREEVKGLAFKNTLRDSFKHLCKTPLKNKLGGNVPMLEVDGMLPKAEVANLIDRVLEL